MMKSLFDFFKPPKPEYDVDEDIKRLREGLEAKRKAAIERMGNKWILHPDNMKQKLDVEANTLGFKTV